jgi:hypothetical protein
LLLVGAARFNIFLSLPPPSSHSIISDH